MNIDEFRKNLHMSFSMSKNFSNIISGSKVIEITERCAMKFIAADRAIDSGKDILYYAIIEGDEIVKIYSADRFDKIEVEYFFGESSNMVKYPVSMGYWWK